MYSSTSRPNSGELSRPLPTAVAGKDLPRSNLRSGVTTSRSVVQIHSPRPTKFTDQLINRRRQVSGPREKTLIKQFQPEMLSAYLEYGPSPRIEVTTKDQKEFRKMLRS